MTCAKQNCKNEEAEGCFLRCGKHQGKCLWGKCRKKANRTSFYCMLHYLAKEANYGLNDTDPTNTVANKRPGGEFYEWGIRRLREFALYCIDEEGI